jgi:hypothetical protein
MRESSIETALVTYAKKHDIYTKKFVSPSNRGVPDRVFIYGGRVLFLELKAPKKKPTPLQMRNMEELLDSGAMVGWTDDREIGKDVLASLRYDQDFWHPRAKDLKFEKIV